MSGDDEWFTLASSTTDEGWDWSAVTETTTATITATEQTPEVAPTESGDVFAYTVMAMIVAGWEGPRNGCARGRKGY